MAILFTAGVLFVVGCMAVGIVAGYLVGRFMGIV